MLRVLLVDDDTELCDLLAEYLHPEGFAVDTVFEGIAGAEKAVSGDYALVVLDVMLPGLSGFDVLRRIRASSLVPVVMLTARGQDVDRIVGLELGADDYLPKPFNPRELIARMRAVLRRTSPSTSDALSSGVLEQGDLHLNLGAMEARRGEELIDLTGTEFSLLESLVRQAGRVVSREGLSREVLGRRLGPFDRSLDVHVSNLRKKLGPLPEGGERIKTIRGVGYLYVRPTQE